MEYPEERGGVEAGRRGGVTGVVDRCGLREGGRKGVVDFFGDSEGCSWFLTGDVSLVSVDVCVTTAGSASKIDLILASEGRACCSASWDGEGGSWKEKDAS